MKTAESKQEIVTPLGSAKAAGLRYVNDQTPGLTRKQRGKSVLYFDTEGKRITAQATLSRIKSLGIPPAWTDVWICPFANGHLQATGRDAKRRKQYRYHPDWKAMRDITKYSRMLEFGNALPLIRKHIDQDLSRSGLPKEKVLASIVKLLEVTAVRIGNEEYVKQNGSYGLTTLEDRHAEIVGQKLHLEFKGKSGKTHSIDIKHPRVAKIVKRCQELPGHELFQYKDEAGQICKIGSADVNEYLSGVTGQHFTAKDFRTWVGTCQAIASLQQLTRPTCQTECKKNVIEIIKTVSHHLGNTPAICRKYYVHPRVIDGFLDGSIFDLIAAANASYKSRGEASWDIQEWCVVCLLKQRTDVHKAAA